MISSFFMGATGPLGDTPAAIANADSGDFVSAVMRSRIGRSLLRNGRDFWMDVDVVLSRLILFHSLWRMEGLLLLLEASNLCDEFLLILEGKVILLGLDNEIISNLCVLPLPLPLRLPLPLPLAVNLRVSWVKGIDWWKDDWNVCDGSACLMLRVEGTENPLITS